MTLCIDIYADRFHHLRLGGPTWFRGRGSWSGDGVEINATYYEGGVIYVFMTKINLTKLSFCHKLWFSNSDIFADSMSQTLDIPNHEFC